jgi:hypothetical protein
MKINKSTKIVMAFVLVILIGWVIYQNVYSVWVSIKYGSSCLEQEISTIPDIIPQPKPYDDNYFWKLTTKYPRWWKPQLNLIQKLWMPDDLIYYILIDEKSIWFQNSIDQLYKYNVITKQLKSYQIYYEDKQNLSTYGFYKTKNGEIWTITTHIKSRNSSLARYRPSSDDFEIIWDKDGLFKQTGIESSDYSGNRFGELSDGQLVVVLDGKIFLFNPFNSRARLLYGGGFVGSIQVDGNDNIWFVDLNESNVISVNGNTGVSTNFGPPPQLKKSIESKANQKDHLKAITIDKQGRIWISYFDRLEPDSNGEYHWKPIELSAVMVETYDPEFAYQWADVLATLVSSNGDIWFVTDGGIVKYDLQMDTWCLSAVKESITNGVIAEDTKGNLWTIDQRQIYKLENQK